MSAFVKLAASGVNLPTAQVRRWIARFPSTNEMRSFNFGLRKGTNPEYHVLEH